MRWVRADDAAATIGLRRPSVSRSAPGAPTVLRLIANLGAPPRISTTSDAAQGQKKMTGFGRPGP